MKKITSTILSLLKEPLGLIDVGASGGIGKDWSEHRSSLFSVGFEPHPQSHERLVRMKAYDCLIRGAVFEEATTVNFHITKKSDVSSIFKPNFDFLNKYRKPERFSIVRTLPMQVNTMDFFLNKHGIKHRDFLSIDTQGTELPIFKGSPETMGNLLGIRTEVEYQPLYVNQPLEPEVHSYLENMGFVKIALLRVHWPEKAGGHILVGGDSMYVRSLEALSTLPSFESKSRVLALKALAVVSTYATTEFFESYLDGAKKYLNENDVSHIQRAANNAEKRTESVSDIYI